MPTTTLDIFRYQPDTSEEAYRQSFEKTHDDLSRLLAMAAALLPAATRSRWRDEWAGELTALPARHQRALFAARTLAGIPRLAATLRRQRRAR